MEELWESGYQPSGFFFHDRFEGKPEYQTQSLPFSSCPPLSHIGSSGFPLLYPCGARCLCSPQAGISISAPVGYPMSGTLLILVSNIYFRSGFLMSKAGTISGVNGFLEKWCILGVLDLPLLPQSPSSHTELSESLVVVTVKQLSFHEAVMHYPSVLSSFAPRYRKNTEVANRTQLGYLLPASDFPPAQLHHLYLGHSFLCVPDCSETPWVLSVFISKAQVL